MHDNTGWGFRADLVDYLPEKKMPSTQAKATSLSANELELHIDVSRIGYHDIACRS